LGSSRGSRHYRFLGPHGVEAACAGTEGGMAAEQPYLVIGLCSLCVANPETGQCVLYSTRTSCVVAASPCARIKW
jgi:hypothetical protein